MLAALLILCDFIHGRLRVRFHGGCARLHKLCQASLREWQRCAQDVTSARAGPDPYFHRRTRAAYRSVQDTSISWPRGQAGEAVDPSPRPRCEGIRSEADGFCPSKRAERQRLLVSICKADLFKYECAAHSQILVTAAPWHLSLFALLLKIVALSGDLFGCHICRRCLFPHPSLPAMFSSPSWVRCAQEGIQHSRGVAAT